MITAGRRVSCRQAPSPPSGDSHPAGFTSCRVFASLCIVDLEPPLGENSMSNKRRNRLGQSKLAANMKVRLDRGAAKLAARTKRRAAKAAA